MNGSELGKIETDIGLIEIRAWLFPRRAVWIGLGSRTPIGVSSA
jgi:hypothetical protein